MRLSERLFAINRWTLLLLGVVALLPAVLMWHLVSSHRVALTRLTRSGLRPSILLCRIWPHDRLSQYLPGPVTFQGWAIYLRTQNAWPLANVPP